MGTQTAKSYVPFAYVMNYASIVDAVFAKWMLNHNPEFVFEAETGFYVYNGKRLTGTKLYKELWPFVTSAVFEVWDWIQASHKERAVQYLFIVNPCGVLNGETGFVEKWKFREERDIKLNFPMFEETFQKIFDKLFKLQVKNRNSSILYLQHENVTYQQMLEFVVVKVFGTTQTSDLSSVFVPKHLVDCCSTANDRNCGELSTVLNWIEQAIGLSSCC